MSETEIKPEGTPTPGAEDPESGAAAEATTAQAEAPATPDLSLELKKALDECAKLKDQLLRTAADYDNFRKRSRKEIDDARARGRNETLTELLPVFDNLQRAVQHAATAADLAAIRSGMEMVLGQLDAALARVGVTPIEAMGKAFDPNRHDAIQQVERDDVPPGTVVEEVQRGYANGERLVRAALVVVARAPSAPPAPGTEPSPLEGDGGETPS